MNDVGALLILERLGVIIKDSHFVYTSGKHGRDYVNKDALYPHTKETWTLCGKIASHFANENVYGIDAVVSPAIGGIVLSSWTAYLLEQFTGRKPLFLYAEKTSNGENFVFNRGYDEFIPGRRILVVEDVLTTGGSVKKVIEAIRALSGNILAVGALCNRGGVIPLDVGGVPEIFSLVSLTLEMWAEKDCPLCKANIPINTRFGKGKEYLAKKS